MTTRPTTRAATGSACATPATAAPAGCSASSSSATATPRSPSGSTSPPTAIFNEMTVDAVSDLDLSYTPPLGSPWDAVQRRRPGVGARGGGLQATMRT